MGKFPRTNVLGNFGLFLDGNVREFLILKISKSMKYISKYKLESIVHENG
jgi:hypothetical protein